MKKIIFSLLLLIVFGCTSYSQNNKPEEDISSSKTIAFLSKDGSFVKKEFYDIGKVKGVECQVLILTDVVKNEKIGCLRLETRYSSSYSEDSYIGTLDYDEIDACIQSLNCIKDNLINTIPDTYTEAEYKTRDGVKIGTYYNSSKQSWVVYVYTKGYTNRSAEFFNSDNLSQMILVMQTAKQKINEELSK